MSRFSRPSVLHGAWHSSKRLIQWKCGPTTGECYSSWASSVADPSNKVQTYLSRSDDPYLNLSFEHFLLEKSPPQSSILFLYVNRPCIVIGRNQNPWLETDLNVLNPEHRRFPQNAIEKGIELGKVDLVRRRSGGGTVFHDAGNVNWTVISPSESFTRDKHAEMVVRALREGGVFNAEVNARHDVVLRRPGQQANATLIKVSGSAYKLTRGRALHHGTCLLNSDNLIRLHDYLTSPGKAFITAKGVESVRSPVANVGISRNAFEHFVQGEFTQLYGQPSAQNGPVSIEEEDALKVPSIEEGYKELQSAEWKFNQTPQFTFCTRAPAWRGISREFDLPESLIVNLQVRHGRITDAWFTNSNPASVKAQSKLIDRSLSDDWLWSDYGQGVEGLTLQQVGRLFDWLQRILPTDLKDL